MNAEYEATVAPKARERNLGAQTLSGHCRPTETEPLPPELQPLMAAEDEEVNATDPIVMLFLKRQRRIKEVKKRREAGVLERLERFAVKKYYTIRRG